MDYNPRSTHSQTGIFTVQRPTLARPFTLFGIARNWVDSQESARSRAGLLKLCICAACNLVQVHRRSPFDPGTHQKGVACWSGGYLYVHDNLCVRRTGQIMEHSEARPPRKLYLTSWTLSIFTEIYGYEVCPR